MLPEASQSLQPHQELTHAETLSQLGRGDPQRVKYSIYAHAHGDHDGGAHLTEAFIPGVTIVYGEGDWPACWPVPSRTRPAWAAE